MDWRIWWPVELAPSSLKRSISRAPRTGQPMAAPPTRSRRHGSGGRPHLWPAAGGRQADGTVSRGHLENRDPAAMHRFLGFPRRSGTAMHHFLNGLRQLTQSHFRRAWICVNHKTSALGAKQYSRTKGSRLTPCSSLRVEGPQAIHHGVARGEDSENDTFDPIFVKIGIFGAPPPRSMKISSAPGRAQPSQRPRSGEK